VFQFGLIPCFTGIFENSTILFTYFDKHGFGKIVHWLIMFNPIFSAALGA
jgi:hypothetical protein